MIGFHPNEVKYTALLGFMIFLLSSRCAHYEMLSLTEVYLRDQKNKVYLYSTIFPDPLTQHFNPGWQIKSKSKLHFTLCKYFYTSNTSPNSDDTQHAALKTMTIFIVPVLMRPP